MQRLGSAYRVLVGLVAVIAMSGCGDVQGMLNKPFVGAVDDCGPRIEAALCRQIAETAVAAIPGPAVAADRLSVSTWDSCQNDQVVGMAPAAAEGTTCYTVMGSGYAGGERLGGGAYRGGTPLTLEAVVWADEDGALRAVVKTAEVDLES
jgi:hypothetical protein